MTTDWRQDTVLDLELIETRRVLGKDFYFSLINKFDQDTPKNLTLLNDLYQKKDWLQLAEEAHRIKGIAANLGASKLADLCYLIQIANNEALRSQIPQYLNQLPNLITQSITQLRAVTATF
ncbi:MAG: hypothetical protein A2527_02370 [Candidatus Lambdaproteobacteria bacterium RIFOXYD2_FULL_50_16]|uniref:HPt domain-containing protein n=1 Tax=Candidatus Lambdaproteobacteria bacterium RIFOXYD2_FULL_50_16 TaxID=1817772 RepID=A0A1F6GDX8_9PROT|nr:MAG: hypothetical protein A2527_02370 [Candidatus Lambdaproteobacteria bacterium RIFOXYD2_FULL_50_16]